MGMGGASLRPASQDIAFVDARGMGGGISCSGRNVRRNVGQYEVVRFERYSNYDRYDFRGSQARRIMEGVACGKISSEDFSIVYTSSSNISPFCGVVHLGNCSLSFSDILDTNTTILFIHSHPNQIIDRDYAVTKLDEVLG